MAAKLSHTGSKRSLLCLLEQHNCRWDVEDSTMSTETNKNDCAIVDWIADKKGLDTNDCGKHLPH